MPKKSFKQIKKELMRGLRVSRRRTKQPVILAMMGVSGAGLSTVGRELAKKLGWSLIEKNEHGAPRSKAARYLHFTQHINLQRSPT